MRIINVDASSEQVQLLEIGYQGENEVTQVCFDISAWQEAFGGGECTIYVKRKGDAEPYFVELPIDGNIATWKVSSTDTANKGNGSAQLNYYVASVLKRTRIYPMKVAKSLVDVGEIPDPYNDWLEEIRQGVHTVEDFAESLTEEVNDWLVAHPEATTTVQDGAITENKLNYSVKNAILQAENPLGAKYVSESDEHNITIATYNVLSANYWRWPVNPPCDTDEGLVKASRNIRIINPDLIGMNEIPDNPKYTPLEKLKMGGYSYGYFFGKGRDGWYQNIDFGNAVMVKDVYDVISSTGVQYATDSGESRCYINTKLETPSGELISVYVTHLDLDSSARADQVSELKTAVASDLFGYKIVMGDFNITYGTLEYYNLLDGWLETVNTDLGTFIQTGAIIDYIFYTSNMNVLDYGTVENSDASDHRMLWAKFSFN